MKIRLNQEDPNEIAHAIICGSAYQDENQIQLIIAQVLIIVSMLLCLLWIYKFIKRMSHFPVKERAPWLALFQSFCFLGIIFIPYITEYTIDFWVDVETVDDVPLSRKILKALYFTVRTFSYLIFIPR